MKGRVFALLTITPNISCPTYVLRTPISPLSPLYFTLTVFRV